MRLPLTTAAHLQFLALLIAITPTAFMLTTLHLRQILMVFVPSALSK